MMSKEAKTSEAVLKSIEVAGFKSFNGRRKMTFEAGISAIVGPNGSGKSNLADAVRWVLGEQRNSRLRVRETEDLVFHGSSQKARASMAEVKILLDNGSGRLPIDASEILISRQLLRSGESNYLLNGRKVRRADIEQLLAKCGFGAQSYTVIGQGMIEALVTSGGVERKLLFEEAAGIRHYELKRRAALKKLVSSEDNLAQTEQILRELLPAQKVLAEQVEMASRKTQLEQDLATTRQQYLAHEYWRLATEETSTRADENESTQLLSELEQAHTKLIAATGDQADGLANNRTTLQDHQEQLARLEAQREAVQSELLQAQSKQIMAQAQVDGINSSVHEDSSTNQLSAVEKKIKTLQAQKAQRELKIAGFEAQIAGLNEKLATKTSALEEVKNTLAKSQRQEFIAQASSLITLMRTQLRRGSKRSEMDLTLIKITRMLELAAADDAGGMGLAIGKLQNAVADLMGAREQIVEKQNEQIIGLRGVELDISAAQATVLQLREQIHRADDLAKQLKDFEQELARLSKTIKQGTAKLEVVVADIELVQTKMNEALNSEKPAGQAQLIAAAEEIARDRANAEQRQATAKARLAELQTARSELDGQSLEWFGKSHQNSQNRPDSQPAGEQVSLPAVLKLEAELGALGLIDPEVITEAKAQTERVEFLQAQQSDLSKAIADTKTLVEQLESQIKQHFEKNFKAINTLFAKFFKDLFGGGEASLTLEREPDTNDFGVEIIAIPPGKKNHSIAQLSGGEKSLASLALLAAIITTNPSPFIILDEVDAALDDENSLKFSEILQILSSRSQILVITHNHETMRSAAHLLGITTAAGNTEILQLSLNAAEQLAAKV